MKLGIVNLGCPKNTVDTECMISQLNGFHITADPAQADYILVNTCAFLKSSRDESVSLIKEMMSYGGKVIIAGCYVSKDIRELKKMFPGAHAFVGVNDIANIKQAVEKGGVYTGAAPYVYNASSHVVLLNGYSAYVKISEGCNHRCSFCTIPSIKGKYRSRRIKDITDEIENLVSSGVREINLISQDLVYYGYDIYGKKTLSRLLRNIMKRTKKKFWLRLLYLYPDMKVIKEITNEMKNDSRLVRYVDIPFQHVSDAVLKSMRRGYRRKDILEICAFMRREIPDVSIRTSLITGYPGETEKDFSLLRDFVRDGIVDKAGIFEYSDEPGTHAFSLKNKISRRKTENRAARLRLDSAENSHYNNKGRVGQITQALCIGSSERSVHVCRTQWDAPDIDNYIFVRTLKKLKPGSVIKVKITGAVNTDLEGEIIGRK